THEAERRGRVELDDAVPQLVARLLERGALGDAGVVDEDVDTPGQRLHELVGRLAVADVTRDRGAPDLLGDHLEVGLGAATYDDARPGAREGTCAGRADPATSSSDERQLAGELHGPGISRAASCTLLGSCTSRTSMRPR